MLQNTALINQLIIKYISNMCPESLQKAIYNKNYNNIYIYIFKRNIYIIFFILKNHLKFMNDFTSVNYPELKYKFNLIYIFNYIFNNFFYFIILFYSVSQL